MDLQDLCLALEHGADNERSELVGDMSENKPECNVDVKKWTLDGRWMDAQRMPGIMRCEA